MPRRSRTAGAAATPETDSLLRGYVVGFARDDRRHRGTRSAARVLENDDVVALDTGADFFLPTAPSCAARCATRTCPASSTGCTTSTPRARRRLGARLGLADPADRADEAGRPPAVHDPGRPAARAPPMPDGLDDPRGHDRRGHGRLRPRARGLPRAADTDVFANGAPPRRAGHALVRRVRSTAGRSPARPPTSPTPASTSSTWPRTRTSAGTAIGAAITWAATLADPTKPAVLIASDPGQPVYERMGYLRVMRLTMWGGAPAR